MSDSSDCIDTLWRLATMYHTIPGTMGSSYLMDSVPPNSQCATEPRTRYRQLYNPPLQQLHNEGVSTGS
jgi:hypothetical protein